MSASVRTVGVTLALVAVGTALALGTQLLLVSLPFPLLGDLRMPLSYVILVVPLAIAHRGNVAFFGFHRKGLWLAVSSGLVLALATLLGRTRLRAVDADGPQRCSAGHPAYGGGLGRAALDVCAALLG